MKHSAFCPPNLGTQAHEFIPEEVPMGRYEDFINNEIHKRTITAESTGIANEKSYGVKSTI